MTLSFTQQDCTGSPTSQPMSAPHTAEIPPPPALWQSFMRRPTPRVIAPGGGDRAEFLREGARVVHEPVGPGEGAAVQPQRHLAGAAAAVAEPHAVAKRTVRRAIAVGPAHLAGKSKRLQGQLAGEMLILGGWHWVPRMMKGGMINARPRTNTRTHQGGGGRGMPGHEPRHFNFAHMLLGVNLNVRVRKCTHTFTCACACT